MRETREIKFRGQRKDNGGWVYGSLMQYVFLGDPMYLILDRGFDSEPGQILSITMRTRKVLPKTVGQFCGLKNKNSKDVYEGDVVDVSMSFEGGTLPHRGVIVYDEEHGAFGTKNEAGVTLLHNHCLHTLEVLGNIHENPELMEQKK